MIYFWAYFKILVPLVVVLVSIAIMCFADVIVMIRYEKKYWRSLLFSSFLLEFLFVLICSTVVFRNSHTDYNYNLVPFWSYSKIYACNWEVLTEVLLNVALFIPIGLLLSGIVRGKRLSKVVLSGILISSTIEILQLVFKKGLCEVDDIIHNTLGCFIGFALYCGLIKLKRRIIE